jgi:phosphoribosylformylglycinamidine cyclo-ligase
VLDELVAGMADACRENACALLGGETAQLPELFAEHHFDLVGTVVGAVERDRLIDGATVRPGDRVWAFPSTGLHTNGYSLARRIVAERMRLGPHDPFPESGGTVADALLAVHRSYLPALAPVLDRVHAMAHITGGGLPGNLDRALPPHLDAVIDTSSWAIPSLFRVLEQAGGVARDEMYRTFNMGVGMTIITPAEHAGAVIASAAAQGVPGWTIGRLRPGGGRVVLEGA